MARLIALTLVVLMTATTDAVHQIRTPICAIDMGSSTFRRIVGSFENGGYEQKPIEKVALGVSDDLARHGKISDAKLAEIEKVLTGFKASCQKEGATRVAAIGTAAFRDAPNGRQVVQLAAKLGIPMEIATEKRESELAYLAGALGQDGHAVIDNGSRSIELVAQAGALRYAVFNLGYRVAFEKFFAPAKDLAAADTSFRNQLRREAAKASFMKGKRKLVGIEFGDMVEVLFPQSKTEGRIFTVAELKQKLAEISSLSAGQFQALKQKTDIDRALPRLVVAAFLTEAFGYSQLELTERELGAGLIVEAGMKKESEILNLGIWNLIWNRGIELFQMPDRVAKTPDSPIPRLPDED